MASPLSGCCFSRCIDTSAIEKKNYQILEAANNQLQRQIEERRRAENALKENERLFRTIFNTCPDGILLSRLGDQALVDVNPGFTELTGYTKEDLACQSGISRTSGECSHLVEIHRLINRTAGVIKNKEFSVPMKSGRRKTALISANTVVIGQEPHMVAVARDISDLKVAEDELRLSYELMKIANENKNMLKMLRQFIDAVQSYTGCSQCIIRLIDENNQIYDAAPVEARPAKCCTCDHQDPLGQCLCALVVKQSMDQASPCLTEFGSFFKQNAGCELADWSIDCNIETTRCARFKFGTLALVPIRVQHQTVGLLQIADEQQNRLGPSMVKFMEAAAMHMGTAIRRLRAEEGLETAYMKLEKRVQDRTHEISKMNRELQVEINERRQVEDRLRKNRNTLQTVIDGVDDSLILLDRDMRFACSIGWRQKHIKSTSSTRCWGNSASMKSGASRNAMHARSCMPSGGERPLILNDPRAETGERIERIAVYPVKQVNDQPGGTIIRISDITEEKRFEKQLIQSEKMASLGILVASIGHEINNPNNFIYFNIPILREYLEMLVRIADQYAEKQPNFELFHMSYPEFREDVFKLVDNIEHGASRISSFVKICGILHRMTAPGKKCGWKWLPL